MDISRIVRVVIVRGSKSVTRAGFGVPLILSSDASFSGVREYTSIDAVEADFLTSTSVYIWAQRLFGQERKPRRIKVAKRTAEVAQVVTMTPTVLNTTEYSVTINGVEFTFTSDGSATAAEIVSGLTTAINAGSEPVTASGSTTLILTADVAGTPFTYDNSANLADVLTTPNNGVIEDAMAAQESDNDWYCLLLTSRDEDDIKNAAAWIETQRKIFIYATEAANVLDPDDDTDIGSYLKGKSYTRTAGIWSDDQDSGPEAAWAGGVLPIDPGGETWKFKTLVGITADNLTDTEESSADDKNVNIYTTVAGVSITAEGKMAGGEFIDTIRFVDWLQAQMEEGVFALLVSVPKVPFSDKGIALVEARMREALERGIKAGGITEYTLDIPKVVDISEADRQDRLLPDLNFNATLAGAVHFVEINGVVQV